MAWEEEAADLGTDLAFWHVGQTDPDYPLEQMGELSSTQERKFRALAIMLLLSEGSTDLFLHNLMRGARTQRDYLMRVKAEGYQDLFFAARGRVDPLLDAIAAEDWPCAREIAKLSVQALQSGEYEDDHHYAAALHAMIEDPPNLTRANAALDAMEAFLAGEKSARLNVLRSIVQADQAAFDAGFEDFLSAFEESIEQARARHQHEDGVVLALREISVEALALLRLCERRGLQTQREYPYCPSLARGHLTVPLREV